MYGYFHKISSAIHKQAQNLILLVQGAFILLVQYCDIFLHNIAIDKLYILLIWYISSRVHKQLPYLVLSWKLQRKTKSLRNSCTWADICFQVKKSYPTMVQVLWWYRISISKAIPKPAVFILALFILTLQCF